MADDGVDHHLSRGHFVVLADECLLFGPVLGERVVNRGLADQLPGDFTVLLSEGLFVIPVLLVKRLGVLAPDLENREREHSHEDVRVFGLLEHCLGERNLRKSGELSAGRVDAEVFDGFLDTEEVLAHDFAGAFLADRRFNASILRVGRKALREYGFGVDAIHGNLGLIAECYHEVLERTVCLTGLNFCPFHDHTLSLLAL